MTVAAVRPVAHDWWVLDRSYQRTALGPDVRAWLAYLELAKAPRTVDQYERDLSMLCHVCPRKRLRQVDDGDLAKALGQVPPGSRRRVKAAYSSFFKWAIKTRRVRMNPVDLLDDIKRPAKPMIRTFNYAEAQQLLSLPLVDAALMGVLLDAGLRQTEARLLQWRNANPVTGHIVVEKGKGGDPRAIPMSDRLRVLLTDLGFLERLEATDYLWYDRPGGGRTIRRTQPVGPTSFKRWWARCLDQAGVQYRKAHTTRHTFATEWRRRGLGLDDVQFLLGHSSIRTTAEYYLHGGLEDVAARMRAIEERMA